MPWDFPAFADRLARLEERLCYACEAAQRPRDRVQLMAVTKTHPAQAALMALQAGLTLLGENRVQELASKRTELGGLVTGASLPPPRWELIGHLQSNKARLAAENAHRIQSVDRAKILTALDRLGQARATPIPILLQVNAGDDPAKFGASIADAPALLEQALNAPGLQVDGLMTIAPLEDNPGVARRCFERLRTLRDDLAERFDTPLSELSMGMTGDLEAAIAAGSTLVRVGTALFGSR